MSSALFGILQLDKGEPAGYANIPGLIQAWLEDAGGFAMVGLVVYLLYAAATPTAKSQSEKLRVPVSMWMMVCTALGLLLYSVYFALVLLGKGAPPEIAPPAPGMPIVVPHATFHKQLQPLLLMIAGAVALLGIGEPFARDGFKMIRRNLGLGVSGLKRFGRAFVDHTSALFSPRRLVLLVAALVAYALVGGALYFSNASRLFGIWTGWLYVGVCVAVCGVLILMLFEAEGPVWAIAKLSFKEAIHSQLLWIFLILLVPFAFRNVLLGKVKPVDEIRSLIGMSNFVLTVLLVFVSALVAALAIPNDIKNLNIYTIVSKPVERFEMVLGRFVGYVSLFSLVLIGATGVSLVLVSNVAASAISPKAREETFKARVPVRGKLEFKSRKRGWEGENVGKEFEYRKYIHGHEFSPQRAIWHFYDIPADLTHPAGDRVPVEFTFDIYKLTKGEQNKGALVSFRLVTYHARQRPPEPTDNSGEWQWQDQARYEAYKKEVERLEEQGVRVYSARPGDPAWAEVNRLAEEYGYFEYKGKEVFDYAVMGIEAPAGLFRNAVTGTPPKERVRDASGVEREVPGSRLDVIVKCETGGQLLGMAEPDLYLLEYEQPFELNYVKSMLGMWCRLCIIVALAVACSTYLSGILSFLLALLVFVLGYFTEHLNDLAFDRNVGGGPFRSFSQLLKAEQPTTPLSDTAGVKAMLYADKFWAWLIRRLQNMIPDVNSLTWSSYVSEGFNVSTEYLVVNLLVTFGYILPWGILAYYLMKSREVAA